MFLLLKKKKIKRQKKKKKDKKNSGQWSETEPNSKLLATTPNSRK